MQLIWEKEKENFLKRVLTKLKRFDKMPKALDERRAKRNGNEKERAKAREKSGRYAAVRSINGRKRKRSGHREEGKLERKRERGNSEP